MFAIFNDAGVKDLFVIKRLKLVFLLELGEMNRHDQTSLLFCFCCRCQTYKLHTTRNKEINFIAVSTMPTNFITKLPNSKHDSFQASSTENEKWSRHFYLNLIRV